MIQRPARPSSHGAPQCERVPRPLEQFADYLTGNWRQEHLHNLGATLELYDVAQAKVADYERHLLAALA